MTMDLSKVPHGVAPCERCKGTAPEPAIFTASKPNGITTAWLCLDCVEHDDESLSLAPGLTLYDAGRVCPMFGLLVAVARKANPWPPQKSRAVVEEAR